MAGAGGHGRAVEAGAGARGYGAQSEGVSVPRLPHSWRYDFYAAGSGQQAGCIHLWRTATQAGEGGTTVTRSLTAPTTHPLSHCLMATTHADPQPMAAILVHSRCQVCHKGSSVGRRALAAIRLGCNAGCGVVGCWLEIGKRASSTAVRLSCAVRRRVAVGWDGTRDTHRALVTAAGKVWAA